MLESCSRGALGLLKRLPLYYESAAHFFMHANYYPNRPFPGQDSQTVLWRSLEDDSLPGRHYSGKTAIVGHSLQKDHKVLDIGHLICIDTGCGYGGLLTAMDTTSGRIWQVTEGGEAWDERVLGRKGQRDQNRTP